MTLILIFINRNISGWKNLKLINLNSINLNNKKFQVKINTKDHKYKAF